jgi:uncharacterized protein
VPIEPAIIPQAHLRRRTAERVDPHVLEGLYEATSRQVAQYQGIKAHVPHTQWFGTRGKLSKRKGEIMSAEKVEAARRLFKAVEERDLAGTLAVYDPEVVIREASFLPYEGVYYGHDGAKQHGKGFAFTWGKFQPSDEKRLDAVFLDAGDRVVVFFRLKGLAANSGRSIDVPVVGVYRVRGGKVVESQMFYSDTSEILKFLENNT